MLLDFRGAPSTARPSYPIHFDAAGAAAPIKNAADFRPAAFVKSGRSALLVGHLLVVGFLRLDLAAALALAAILAVATGVAGLATALAGAAILAFAAVGATGRRLGFVILAGGLP